MGYSFLQGRSCSVLSPSSINITFRIMSHKIYFRAPAGYIWGKLKGILYWCDSGQWGQAPYCSWQDTQIVTGYQSGQPLIIYTIWITLEIFHIALVYIWNNRVEYSTGLITSRCQTVLPIQLWLPDPRPSHHIISSATDQTELHWGETQAKSNISWAVLKFVLSLLVIILHFCT